MKNYLEAFAKDWDRVMAEMPTWSQFCNDCSSFAQSPDFLPCLIMLIGLIGGFFGYPIIYELRVKSNPKSAHIFGGWCVILLVTLVAVYITCKITGSDFFNGMFC